MRRRVSIRRVAGLTFVVVICILLAHGLRRLGVPPGEFLYLGDTNTDMKTAVAAGMFSVGALWGFRDAEELKAHGAEVLIESPMELLDLL